MNLAAAVNHVISVNTRDLYFLLKFVEDIEAYIEQRSRPGSPDYSFVDVPEDVKPEFVEFFKEFLELMLENEESTSRGEVSSTLEHIRTYSEKVKAYLLPAICRGMRPLMYPDYLYDMTLTHGITIFEAFLGDFLAAILTQRPKALKSEKTASYQDILSFTSMKALIDYLAAAKVKEVLSYNVDGIAGELQKLFSIDISRCSDFNVIREAFCRRHVVVHNKGITDKKYCEKIPNSQVDVKLLTNYEYLKTLFAAFGQLVDYLDEHFSRKMHYKREPRGNMLLTGP